MTLNKRATRPMRPTTLNTSSTHPPSPTSPSSIYQISPSLGGSPRIKCDTPRRSPALLTPASTPGTPPLKQRSPSLGFKRIGPLKKETTGASVDIIPKWKTIDKLVNKIIPGKSFGTTTTLKIHQKGKSGNGLKNKKSTEETVDLVKKNNVKGSLPKEVQRNLLNWEDGSHLSWNFDDSLFLGQKIHDCDRLTRSAINGDEDFEEIIGCDHLDSGLDCQHQWYDDPPEMFIKSMFEVTGKANVLDTGGPVCGTVNNGNLMERSSSFSYVDGSSSSVDRRWRRRCNGSVTSLERDSTDEMTCLKLFRANSLEHLHAKNNYASLERGGKHFHTDTPLEVSSSFEGLRQGLRQDLVEVALNEPIGGDLRNQSVKESLLLKPQVADYTNSAVAETADTVGKPLEELKSSLHLTNGDRLENASNVNEGVIDDIVDVKIDIFGGENFPRPLSEIQHSTNSNQKLDVSLIDGTLTSINDASDLYKTSHDVRKTDELTKQLSGAERDDNADSNSSLSGLFNEDTSLNINHVKDCVIEYEKKTKHQLDKNRPVKSSKLTNKNVKGVGTSSNNAKKIVIKSKPTDSDKKIIKATKWVNSNAKPDRQLSLDSTIKGITTKSKVAKSVSHGGPGAPPKVGVTPPPAGCNDVHTKRKISAPAPLKKLRSNTPNAAYSTVSIRTKLNVENQPTRNIVRPAAVTGGNNNTGPNIRPINRTNLSLSRRISTVNKEPPKSIKGPVQPKTAAELKKLEAALSAKTSEATEAQREAQQARIEAQQSARGLEALTVLVHHLTNKYSAFSNPSLKAEICDLKKCVQEKEDALECSKAALSAAQCALVEEKKLAAHQEEQMKRRHQEEREELLTTHQRRLEEQEEKTNFALEDLRKEGRLEIKHRDDKHEEAMKILTEEHQKKLSEMLSVQAQELTSHQPITKSNVDAVMQELTSLHESKEAETAENHSSELREQTKKLQDTLLSDTDHRLTAVKNYCTGLQSEIDSLKSVVEMRNSELHKLRLQVTAMEQLEKDLDALRERNRTLMAKTEDLNAQMNAKAKSERELMASNRDLSESMHKESCLNKQLRLENEELQWKLTQREQLSQSLPPMATLDLMTRSSCEAHHPRLTSPNGRDQISASPKVRRSQSTKDATKIDNKHQNGTALTPIGRATSTPLGRTNSSSDSASPPASPSMKGVVAKSNSVSFILDLNGTLPENNSLDFAQSPRLKPRGTPILTRKVLKKSPNCLSKNGGGGKVPRNTNGLKDLQPVTEKLRNERVSESSSMGEDSVDSSLDRVSPALSWTVPVMRDEKKSPTQEQIDSAIYSLHHLNQEDEYGEDSSSDSEDEMNPPDISPLVALMDSTTVSSPSDSELSRCGSQSGLTESELSSGVASPVHASDK